jgi:hypothetical protein
MPDFYDDFKALISYCGKNQAVTVVDSDDEESAGPAQSEPAPAQSQPIGCRADKRRRIEPRAAKMAIQHAVVVDPKLMTVSHTYFDKKITFKGNQFIMWARHMYSKLIKTPHREAKIKAALASRTALIRQPDDWLDYEGMFDAFRGMPAKISEPFHGILTVHLTETITTTIEFKNKAGKLAGLLYAHLHDRLLLNYLSKILKFSKYQAPTTHGLSYSDLVAVINKIMIVSKGSRHYENDRVLAARQLALFQVNKALGNITPIDRFLTYFNAILFGSETSRNSLTFITSILTLNFIADGKLTYEQAFKPPPYAVMVQGKQASVAYAVFPMASPYTGTGNFKAYNKLLQCSQTEHDAWQLSSTTGMGDSRMYSQLAQVHLKEAVLLKDFSSDIEPKPQWLGAQAKYSEQGHAVEFAKQFYQKIGFLLSDFFRTVTRTWVFSKDEDAALLFLEGTIRPHATWRKLDPKSSITTFNAFDFKLVPASQELARHRFSQHLRREKDEFDAQSDWQAEVLAENPPGD